MPKIMASKLLPPYAGANLIERPRLVELLSRAGQRKATILTAPAGYGKTVLMVQLAAASKKPLVWYQLDDYDNDPAVFMQYLVAGIQQHYPAFGKDALLLVAQSGVAPRLRLLVTTVVNGLEKQAPGGLVIALDDYQVISEPVLHSFIEELLRHLPAGVQIVIASRTVLPLPLSRLNLRGEVCTVGWEELRFTRQEIGVFLARSRGETADEAIAAVERKTAGWPAALGLLGNSSATVAEFLADQGAQKIYDYLAVEVFDRQPEAVRTFLCGSSVLEEITPALCDQLLERTDSRAMLGFLEKQQLFLIPLAGKRQAYRYHDLLREFLRDRLGPERQTLLCRAGLLARQAGELESAVEYLTAAGAYEELPAVIKEAGNKTFGRGQWQTVARWLESLPAATLAADPWLALYRAKVEVYRGRLDEAENWLNQIARLSGGGEQANLPECWLLQARIMRCRGRYTESLALLTQITQQMSEEEITQRFDLPMEKSLCLLMSGQLDQAEAELTAAIASAELNGDNYGIAHLLEGLGNIYCAQGQYPQSLQTFQKAVEISPERILPSYYMQDGISFIYYDWGEWERAFDYAKRNVAIKENFGLTEVLPSAYVQLAILYSGRNEWEPAEKYFNMATDLLRRNSSESFYLALNLIYLADCLCLQGRWSEARIKVEEALAEARPQGGISLAICQAMAAMIFFHTGDVCGGKDLLAAATRDCEQMGLKRGQSFVYTYQALLSVYEGNPAAARKWAEKAFTLLARINFQQIFLNRPKMLQPVLKIGLEKGYEVPFVQRVLVRLGEQTLGLLDGLAGHADPAVRRRTIAPLAEIGGSRAQETIRRLEGDPDREVRQTARLATRRIGILAVAANPFAAAATPLQIVTFGPFRVSWEATGVGAANWRTAKTRDLLAYFCHHRAPVSKEEIFEDLWPDFDLENAAGIFHTTLYYLRRFLDKAGCREAVIYGGGRYGLRPGISSSDRQQFEELVAAGLRADVAPDTAVSRLEQAVSLYRGHYLADLDYPWLIPDQEKLKHVCIKARLRLAGYYLEAPDYARAIAHLQTAEEDDPFNEDVHGLLMTAYAGQGNRPAVKKQYQKLEDLLKSELALSPSQAIRELCRKLLE